MVRRAEGAVAWAGARGRVRDRVDERAGNTVRLRGVNASTMNDHTTPAPLSAPAPAGARRREGRAVVRVLLLATLLAWSALLSALRAAGPVDPPSSVTAALAVDEDAFLRDVAALAVVERLRSGVPASITAAQAILESDWGRATVAAAGNNYFGIKCKAHWRGATVAHVDDDRDASGAPVESCFRAYGSRAESFRDHSDFLTASARYAPLFAVDPLDYRGWARGLASCGYATDQLYADKLIALVERLELYTLDWPEVIEGQWLVALTEPETAVDLEAVRASAFLRPASAARRGETAAAPAAAAGALVTTY